MPGKLRVAFQGEKGAYSEIAALRYLHPKPSSVPALTVGEVFRMVEEGSADCGIVPVENAIGGNILETYDCLLQSQLHVSGEIFLEIHHCLAALPGSTLGDVRKVYSHPQALEQCSRYLKSKGFQLIPTYDTAGSVRMIVEAGDRTAAAVASREAAELHGMKILKSNIENSGGNQTRFLVISKEDVPPSRGCKTSITFSVDNVPGTLYRFLQVFAEHGINLSKIESRPSKEKMWEYVFFIDFEGHAEMEPAKSALIELRRRSSFLKILGSYRSLSA